MKTRLVFNKITKKYEGPRREKTNAEKNALISYYMNIGNIKKAKELTKELK